MGVKEDKNIYSSMVFQKEVHAYVLHNYNHPKYIAYQIKELKGNLPLLMK